MSNQAVAQLTGQFANLTLPLQTADQKASTNNRQEKKQEKQQIRAPHKKKSGQLMTSQEKKEKKETERIQSGKNPHCRTVFEGTVSRTTVYYACRGFAPSDQLCRECTKHAFVSVVPPSGTTVVSHKQYRTLLKQKGA
jgi:hypothetical protein